MKNNTIIKTNEGVYVISKNNIKYSIYANESILKRFTSDMYTIVLDDYFEELENVENVKTTYLVDYYYGLSDLEDALLKSDEEKIKPFLSDMLYSIDKFEEQNPKIVEAITKKKKTQVEEVFKKMKIMVEAVQDLADAFVDCEYDLNEIPGFCENYPFDKDFLELSIDISLWYQSIDKN